MTAPHSQDTPPGGDTARSRDAVPGRDTAARGGLVSRAAAA